MDPVLLMLAFAAVFGIVAAIVEAVRWERRR